MPKQLFSIVGRTEENNLVISGIFRFKETHGMTLDVIFDCLKDRNMVPSWLHLLEESENAGVNFEKFMTELEYSIINVYGKKYWSKISPLLTTRRA